MGVDDVGSGVGVTVGVGVGVRQPTRQLAYCVSHAAWQGWLLPHD